MMINDESNYILFCKRTFSDILEGVASTTFLGQARRPPFSNSIPVKYDFWNTLLEATLLEADA